MDRKQANEYLRSLLDANGLEDWHIRQTTDLTRPYLGLCSYKDKCIILNAHHIDTHGEDEVIDTIRHEVAHALTPGAGHGDVWKSKAIELGASPNECVTYSLDATAIDAIRSGATVEVTYETRTVREPKYKITRLQDKCPTCGKVAKEKSRIPLKTPTGHKVVITFECGHLIIRDADSRSLFEDITFDGDVSCKHVWGIGRNRTTCEKCNAHKLYDYQIEGCKAIERANGRFALFDEMGLGKTIMPLAYLKEHPEIRPFLWVTKSGIKFQHVKEIMRLLGRSEFPQVLQSSKDILIPGMSAVVSYDIFRRLDLQMFINHGFKIMVLDECQAIKNPDSARTQCIRTIAKHIPMIIPLSGTPWKNRGSEFFVVLNMLDPKLFWSYEGFKKQWVNYYWQGNREKEGGIRDPKKFREYISHIAIRRERKDVMPELPIISRNRLNCEVDDYARKTYEKEESALMSLLNDAMIDGRENSLEVQQQAMTALVTMRQILGIAKVPTTVEFAQDFLSDTDRKLVVFVHHKECGKLIVQQMTEWCLAQGMAKPLVLTADLKPEERFAVQELFNGPSHRLLIASTLASGEGLNLQTCSDCVMHERQWNPANEMQAEGRFIRIGQLATAVTATYVHADDSIDIDLDGIVEGKRKEFDNTMNREGFQAAWQLGENTILSALYDKIRNRKKAA